ncbi:MAG: hypothetical protein Q9160_002537 [Pyrenula sp. 1 TL-2023]
MHPDSSKAVLYGPRCLASIGAGILFPMPLFAVQARQKGDDVGIATSIQVFARSLGTAFGVALGGVIFQNEWTKLVDDNVMEKRIPITMAIPSSLAEIAYETIERFPEPVQEAYRWVYSDSMRTVWWVMMGLSIVGLLISLTARNDEIRGGLSGSQNFQDKTTSPKDGNTDFKESMAPHIMDKELFKSIKEKIKHKEKNEKYQSSHKYRVKS